MYEDTGWFPTKMCVNYKFLAVEPPAPRNLTTVEIQRDEIQLTWMPPEFHEIYNVLQYIVEFKKFGKEWQSRTTENDHIKSYRITDLEAETRYLLKVSAKNEYGISIPSAILRKRTPPGRASIQS